jgi:hypothetical protein
MLQVLLLMVIMKFLAVINFVKLPVKPFCFAAVWNVASTAWVVQADLLQGKILENVTLMCIKISLSASSAIPIY